MTVIDLWRTDEPERVVFMVMLEAPCPHPIAEMPITSGYLRELTMKSPSNELFGVLWGFFQHWALLCLPCHDDAGEAA